VPWKKCREITESNLNECRIRPGRSTTDQISLSSKFMRNLGSMPKTSTYALSTSRKHSTGFLVKRFVKCCGSTVLTAACCRLSSHCIPDQKFVPVSGELTIPFAVGIGLRKGCVLSFFFIVYLNWIDSHSRVDEGVTFGSCRINRLLFTDDLVLLASSQQSLQHAFDRFSAACDRTGMKINTKNTEVLCLSTNPRQCMLQVSGNALQQVEKFKHLGVVFASDGRWSEEIDTRIGEANAVLHELYRSVVTKRELSNTTKLSVFKSVFVPILTYGHQS